MDLSNLYKLLGIDSNSIPAKQIEINSEDKDLYIKELINGIYSDKRILLKDAKIVAIEKDKQHVKISGNAIFLNVNMLPTLAEFWLDSSGNLQFCISYQLPNKDTNTKKWRFSDSFTKLPLLSKVDGPFYNDPETNLLFPEANVPLDEFNFFEPFFVVCSCDKHQFSLQNETKVDVSKGLNFISKLSSKEIFPWLGSVFEVEDVLSVQGKIEFPKGDKDKFKTKNNKVGIVHLYPWDLLQDSENELPGILLKVDLPVEKSLGDMFSFKGDAIYIYTPINNEWVTWDMNPSLIPIMGYEGVSKFDKHEIEMVLEIPYGANSLKLAAFSSDTKLDGLAELNSFLGTDVELKKLFPEFLKDLLEGVLMIDILNLMVSIDYQKGLAIPEISLLFGFPKLELSLFDNHFELNQISSRIKVLNSSRGNGKNNRKIYTDVYGRILFEGIAFDVQASDLHGFTLLASTKEKIDFSIDKLANALSLEEMKFPFELAINRLSFEISPGKFYSAGLGFAEKKDAWRINLGKATLSVSDIFVNLNYAKGTPLSIHTGGTITLAGLTTVIGGNSSGEISIRGSLDSIKLSKIVHYFLETKLIGPNGFDLTFAQSYFLIQKKKEEYDFALGTTIANFGSLFFAVQKNTEWGYALGLDMQNALPSKIAGFGFIKAIEETINMNKLMLVISSFDSDEFSFPDATQFNNPTLVPKGINLPSNTNLTKGLNFYGEWIINTEDTSQKLLKSFLGTNPTLGIGIQIQDTSNAKAFVKYETKIKETYPLNCQFGVILDDGKPSLFLSGDMTFPIQDSQQTFSVTSVFTPNGAFLAGSMTGDAAVKFGDFQLANLAVEIGINLEGIPSFGIAATLDIKEIETSIALFFDSANPSQSMLAGSVSDLNLKKVIESFAGDVPDEIDEVLETIEIKGTDVFTISSDLASDLDNKKLDKVSKACQEKGELTIPTQLHEVLLVINEKGKRWFFTDMTKMRHYSFILKDDGIEVSTQAQFYFAPQDTHIGKTLNFRQGIYLNGHLEFLGFSAEATVEVERDKGILVDAHSDPLVILNKNLFSLTAAEGDGGPNISICSYTKDDEKPHFKIDGQLTVLGRGEAVNIDINKDGGKFTISLQPVPGVEGELSGHFKHIDDLSIGGDVKIGIEELDLSPLGKIDVDTYVEGKIEIGVIGEEITNKITCTCSVIGKNIDFELEIDLETVKLEDLASLIKDKLIDEAKDIILDDIPHYFSQLKDGAIKLGEAGVEEITEMGSWMKDKGLSFVEFGFGVDFAFSSITDKDMAKILHGANFSPHDIASFVTGVYNLGKDAIKEVLDFAGIAVDAVGDFFEDTFDIIGDWTWDSFTVNRFSITKPLANTSFNFSDIIDVVLFVDLKSATFIDTNHDFSILACLYFKDVQVAQSKNNSSIKIKDGDEVNLNNVDDLKIPNSMRVPNYDSKQWYVKVYILHDGKSAGKTKQSIEVQ